MENKLLEKAKAFAKEKHQGQYYNSVPYINHPILVELIVSQLFPTDINLRCAAFLHDTIEDCGVIFNQLEGEFNLDVASLVWEATKDKDANFPNLNTDRGLILKTADRLANVSNLGDLEDSDRHFKLFRKYSHCPRNEGTHRIKK